MANLRKEKLKGTGAEQGVKAGSGSGQEDSIGLGVAGPGTSKAEASTKESAVKGPSCHVDGQEVSEMYLRFVGYAVYAVADGRGQNEVSRVHYQAGKGFDCNWGANKIGQFQIKAVEYRTLEGLTIHMHDDYKLFVPAAVCQATWR